MLDKHSPIENIQAENLRVNIEAFWVWDLSAVSNGKGLTNTHGILGACTEGELLWATEYLNEKQNRKLFSSWQLCQ